MPDYAIYNKNSGEIKRIVGCDQSLIDIQLDINEDYVEGNDINDVTQHIDLEKKEVINKKVMPYTINKSSVKTDSIDMVSITIPTGAKIYSKGMIDEVVSDKVFEFTTDCSGIYNFTFSCFPYLDQEVIINAA